MRNIGVGSKVRAVRDNVALFTDEGNLITESIPTYWFGTVTATVGDAALVVFDLGDGWVSARGLTLAVEA